MVFIGFTFKQYGLVLSFGYGAFMGIKVFCLMCSSVWPWLVGVSFAQCGRTAPLNLYMEHFDGIVLFGLA